MLAFNNVLNGSGEMKNTANRKKNKREDRKQIINRKGNRLDIF